MTRPFFPALTLFSLVGMVPGQEPDFPIVADDFEVSLFARDPLVRNPCAICFDAKGRLCVGMGPQYRNPKPDSPPDSVWIITDEDHDGSADKRQKFATGFNSIQGLAWKGDWLWIANAPDLTRVRDTDGDDVADEYIRVYTDLGNLEHGLHGLNFGPDGRLYMSKGNSKGLTIVPDRLAPAPFRNLWGVAVPGDTPEPKPVAFTASTYQKNYHDPRDDWGRTGGILRCHDDGSGLEIFSQGFRNPWDITFDHNFDWLGTDNDQTMGDKIFTPFLGAHFGWGHSWSYDWKGDQHLPTAPSSGPLFEGSGTGMMHCMVPGYPEKYRDLFLINDWLNREVLIYRTRWEGAWRKSDRKQLEVLAHADGGRSMPLSSGRAFDPVDLEIGPDGAIWISSWGRQYGAHYEKNSLANEGRVYRLWPESFSPTFSIPKMKSTDELVAALGSSLPVWRSNAQEELIQRGRDIESTLLSRLRKPTSTAQETWLVWTIGRINPEVWFDGNRNQKIQSIRLAAFHRKMRPEILTALSDPEPRVRLAAVLALREIGETGYLEPLVQLAAREKDRIVSYATWGALMTITPVAARKELLMDKRPGVRLAAFLGLLEEDSLSEEDIQRLLDDSHPPITQLARKRLGGKDTFEQKGRPLRATGLENPGKALVVPFDQIKASSGQPYRPAILAPGARLYTDRDYRITEVPPSLQGLTFLQSACHDADASRGITVTLNLRYPSTVYLIDDARAESLPTWARGTWKPTGMEIKGDDPKVLKVYSAELPAGLLTLGTSRDGIQARKGNYLLAVRPILLSPTGKRANEESILPLLENADPDRGRDLFLSPRGTHCAACHRVADLGKNHAPDLTHIGSRADAPTLIKSIIHPSADIVEGFAAHLVETKSGESYSGTILEETGRDLTLALADGKRMTLPLNHISRRETLPISAMPGGYDSLLSSQQLADLVAWLLSQKKEEPITINESGFAFQKAGKELHLFLGKTKIATYLSGHGTLTRPAFVNLRTPSGLPVTRNFPPQKPEDLDPGYRDGNGIIHPVMHPGLWMSFGWIDGNDYWRLNSRVVHQSFLKEPSAQKSSANFQTRDRYLSQSGNETICFQDTTYRFQQVPEGILLDWEAVFYNDERDFTFGDQEESGLAFRIASPLRVQGGNGRIVNDRGESNGAGTWGKPFEWISYSGAIGKNQVGLLVIPDPENPRKSWSHSRDYGVLVSNPFPKQPRERREPYLTSTITKGQRFRLRYRILIHEVPAREFSPVKLVEGIRSRK